MISTGSLHDDALEIALGTLPNEAYARVRETEEYDRVAAGASCLVLVGAGFRSALALAGAKKAGLPVVAVTDSNPARQGQMMDGVPILSPQEAVDRYNRDAAFVITIYNGNAPREQLRALGCARIVEYPVFFWRFPEFVSPNGFELPHRILEQMSDIRNGYRCLSDEPSRKEFATQLQWRCTLDAGYLLPPAPLSEIYYPPDLFRLGDREVLVDCGAFDGDSIRFFLDKTHGRFQHIYALEPDSRNRSALQQYVESLPEPDQQRISVLPYGVSDESRIMSFAVTGTMGSSISSNSGTDQIECRPLDAVLSGPAPTMIKMDLEGAEPSAIRGAKEVIRRARPILAVCAYHDCDHLWKLPVMIKEALPEYSIFLRRYAEECWETVYYAIPPERLLPQSSAQ